MTKHIYCDLTINIEIVKCGSSPPTWKELLVLVAIETENARAHASCLEPRAMHSIFCPTLGIDGDDYRRLRVRWWEGNDE